jgi:N-methylhydantoinase A
MSMVGIDIGGTFTDLVAYRDGAILTAKTLTVAADPIAGAAAALRIAGCEVSAVAELLHGSTIAINTVLERSGAATALLTTEGFRDVYALGRGNRPDAFNLDFHRPRPLVPRDLAFEVRERMNAAGEVLVPIDLAAVEALAGRLDALGIEAVAVCFLHAYANPAHEIAAGELLRRRCPALFVTTSHEILREFREYERTSTTALNAFVGPRVSRYLARFEGFAREEKFTGKIAVMRSNGGTMSIAEARRRPVAMMESGPVAGMIGAGHLARLIGIEQAIGFDMGGTTAKTALIAGGVLPIAEGYVIGDAFTGQPMQLPVVDIVEVGAGGGSIAWCDENGGLHVGPVSAGADPGPACYSRGGDKPTVTDADLVLGRLNGERFLGGGMKLDRVAAEAAIRAGIGDRLGLDPATAAFGIATIADAAMSLAVRAVSVDRGIDPRDTAVIAFGGAGPLHAAAIAREISIPKIVVPKLPGTFSALGMLMAEWRQDFVRTLIGELDRIDPAEAARAFADLRTAGEEALSRDRLSGGRLAFAADLRYRGQEHTIAIAVAGPGDFADAEATRRRFDEHHARRHGHAAPDQSVEIVNLRLVVSVPRLDDAIAQWLGAPFLPERAAPEERRPVVFDDPQQPVEARILWRPGLAAGTEIVGPAVIEEPNSTILVPPGDQARIDPWGNIVIALGERV